MKQTPHIDRQHVKQMLHRDELGEGLLKARDWIRGHLEAVVIGALVLAATVFGIVFFINGQKQKDLEASKLLNEAHQIFLQSGQVAPEQAASAYGQAYAKFQAVATTYDGTEQAQDAKLGMANAQYAMGKFADAEREYAQLDSGKAGDAIGALAAYGKARALEAQGKAADAKNAYLAAANRYPGSAVQALAEAASKR